MGSYGRFDDAMEKTTSPPVQRASNNKDSPFDQVHSIVACA